MSGQKGVCKEMEHISIHTNLNFNEESEQDVVSWINGLTRQRRLGQVISDALRQAYNSTQVKEEPIPAEFTELLNKVNGIYDIMQELRVMTLVGNHLGLIEKVEVNEVVYSLIELYTRRLARTLGVPEDELQFNSEKEVSSQEMDKTAEFIIQTYGSMLSSLKVSQPIITYSSTPTQEEVKGVELPKAKEVVEDDKDNSSIKISELSENDLDMIEDF